MCDAVTSTKAYSSFIEGHWTEMDPIEKYGETFQDELFGDNFGRNHEFLTSIVEIEDHRLGAYSDLQQYMSSYCEHSIDLSV